MSINELTLVAPFPDKELTFLIFYLYAPLLDQGESSLVAPALAIKQLTC